MPIAAFRAFRHRKFTLLWVASLISNIGTWMQTVAVGALTRVNTGQALWTALVFIAGFLPNGVLAPIGGALADRLDRRRFIIAATSIETAMAFLLAFLVAKGHDGPLLVTSVIFVAGCVASIRQPFQQSMLPDLVPPEDIVGAVSLGSTQWNLGRVVGPAAAGLLIALGSYSLAFIANGISFLAVIAAFVLIKLPDRTTGDAWNGLFSHIKGGMRVVRDEPGCRSAVILIGAVAALAGPFIALVPARAADLVAHQTGQAVAAATGGLTTAQGVGAVIGALLLADLVQRLGRERVLVTAIVVTAISLTAFAVAPNLLLAGIAITVLGGAYISVLSGLSAVVQLRAPSAFRGRVISLYFATLSVVFPFGALIMGAVGDRVGLGWTMSAGAAALTAVLLYVALRRPHLLHALNEPASDHEPPMISDPQTGQAAAG